MDSQSDDGRGNEQTIRKRIEKLAKLGDLVHVPGDHAIHKICQDRRNQQDQRTNKLVSDNQHQEDGDRHQANNAHQVCKSKHSRGHLVLALHVFSV